MNVYGYLSLLMYCHGVSLGFALGHGDMGCLHMCIIGCVGMLLVFIMLLFLVLTCRCMYRHCISLFVAFGFWFCLCTHHRC